VHLDREFRVPATPIVVGGRAADDVWARETGADIFTDDPKEVVGLLELHHESAERPSQSSASR
jgi:methanogenic corrinoid protein MtbC1